MALPQASVAAGIRTHPRKAIALLQLVYIERAIAQKMQISGFSDLISAIYKHFQPMQKPLYQL
ncbi:hypothetical protein PI95_010850 [Hassallia byssoidea VB512170]|uniref:Uncharacterized protein n=1 Tax=Hassallia byssoidea VB512170 TaxID=1304833 RepID=A0A846H8N6_9CYAN|nr:hypothetical protein [Hassalia byssoidea]NEU73044.1 hypothetical protein [Hassalia byssoidea VB512170]